MGDVRAAVAMVRMYFRWWRRYPIAMVSSVFNALYQGVIPGLLFGASFAVGGRVVGLESTVGTDNLVGFIFLGGVITGLVSSAFWGIANALRQEMETGTLEALWLTPTRRHTFVVGYGLGAVLLFLFNQIALFTFGFAFFGLTLRGEILLALPSVILAELAMIGIAYTLAALVLLMREANFFIDTTNFLFSTASGVAFPITMLPLVFQPIALILPTTYAVDLLRHHAIGTRLLFDPVLEYALLLATTAITFPIGRWMFARTERRMRVTGALSQY
jgi:ABC-2 type transport system permease protein